MKRIGLVVLFAPALLAMGGEPFRHARPIEAPAGWTLLELPDDVLDHARPGLADLRVEGPHGEEIAWLDEARVARAPATLEPFDVESVPGRETTALLDRGEHPAPCAALSIVVDGDAPFLKPVTVEASDERASFRELSRGSIFRTAGAEMTTVRFAPTDRRFLRLRFDDRNGDPIAPRAVTIEPPAPAPSSSALRLTPSARVGEGGVSTWSMTLPSSGLALEALRLDFDEPAFARRARVYERVLFRDELSRRLVGEGMLLRAAGAPAPSALPLAQLAGRALELEVDDAGSPPLHLRAVEAVKAPTRILFFAPSGPGAKLLYGSDSAAPPRYDLAAALAHGRPEHPSEGRLGPEARLGDVPPSIAAPTRGPTLDAAAWPRRQPIVLPAAGNVAWLDLPAAIASSARDLRIVDARGAQVPFLFESRERAERQPVTPRLTRAGRLTTGALTLEPGGRVATLELTATAPSYFEREVTAFEELSDARGPTRRHVLGRASWVRAPGAPSPALRIGLSPPSGRELGFEIDDGDNPPLTLGPATLELALHRVDFVFAPGDALTLLSGNPAAEAPKYDFALLASAVLRSPAAPARLGELAEAPTAPARRGPWLAVGVVVAGALVLLVLARTLRGEAR